jgi:hypothetical protein
MIVGGPVFYDAWLSNTILLVNALCVPVMLFRRARNAVSQQTTPGPFRDCGQ